MVVVLTLGYVLGLGVDENVFHGSDFAMALAQKTRISPAYTGLGVRCMSAHELLLSERARPRQGTAS